MEKKQDMHINNELLIDAVADYPWIFDPRSAGYRDVKRKNNSWADIESRLGLPPDSGMLILGSNRHSLPTYTIFFVYISSLHY